MIIDTGTNARWVPVVTINAVDVTARLTGSISISAAESSARVASLSLIPASSSALAGYDNQPITIDVTLSRTGATSETYRLFTGIVESHSFSAVDRVAELSARDAWYELRASGSAESIEALFAGVTIYPSWQLLPWNLTDPDPEGYFDGLLATACGSLFIDADGTLQAVPWTIGTPAVTFGSDDIDDGSMIVTASHYSELPASVVATLAHRHHRLHCATVDVTWDRVERTLYITKGLPTLPKSTIQAALDGISDWWIKGSATLTEPIPGTYMITVGGSSVPYIVSPEQAMVTCDAMDATLYRRWYQEIEVRYNFEFVIGGLSDNINVTDTLKSDFDAGAWESPKRIDSSNSLYADNAPTPVIMPTGYEALTEPYPPTNSAMDYIGLIDHFDVVEALNHVSAKGLRIAALAKRKQTVKISRVIDPRFEIGDVIAFDCYGVSGYGQVVELDYSLDLDTGDATASWTLAMPEGSGTVTGFTVDADAPTPTVEHALDLITLGNHIGSSYDTPDTPVEDALEGFLCNVVATSDDYDATAPRYNTQFRIIMPSIAAGHRDPISEDVAATGSYTIADGNLVISF